MCSRSLRPLGLPIYVARVPAAPFSLLPSSLYLDHSHPPVLAPATLAALPSTRASPDRDVFYVGNPFPVFLLSLLVFLFPLTSNIPFLPFFFLIFAFSGSFSREALAHRNHPGRTRGFSRKTRRAFLSREADYRLDLQKTRRLLRRDDGSA